MSTRPPLLHRQEVARLRVLESVGVLDTAPEAPFDALARSAAHLLAAPGARLHLVTAQHVWPKACHGLPALTLPRAGSACARVVADDAPAVITAPGVSIGLPGVQAYVGVPVHVEGLPVGTLCAVDTVPREWGAEAVARLRDLAGIAGTLLAARRSEKRWQLRQQRVRDASRAGADWLWETDPEGRLGWLSDDVESHLGLGPDVLLGRTLAELHCPRDDETSVHWRAFATAWQERQPFNDAVGDTDTPLGRVTVSFSGTPVFDLNGRFGGYRGAGRVVTEDLEAQLAARRAEALLRDTLDGLPAGVAVSDAAGRIVMANAQWYAQLGDVETPPGPLTWPSLVRALAYGGHYPGARGREEAFIEWRLGLAAQQPQAHELRWRDGWGLVTDQRLPSGHVVHLSVDHTAQKNAERALAALQRRQLESDAQLSAVLAAVPDLWFVVDAQGRYARVSSPRHPSLTMPFEALAGQPFERGLPPDVGQRATDAIQRARTLGRVQRFEYTLRTLDGQERNFEARVSPMPGGELLYLTRDLTEVRNLERDVLLMQRAFESPASLPIVIADVLHGDLGLVYVNTAFEQLGGWARHEVLGRPFDFFAASDAPGRALLHDALRQRSDATLVVDGRRRDGSRFVNELTIIAARDADGRTTHLIGLLHDLSERQQTEQARQEKIVAEMASRSKTEFMSRMSHEMRTPLNAIIGFAQLLRLRAGTRVDHVDHILNAGRHLLTLVNDVLDLQRVEADDLALNLAPVAVQSLLDDCITMLGPLAEARAVTQQRLPAEAPLFVRADAQRLRQVLLNIGSNAVKYNRPTGRVVWSAAPADDGRVVVTIEDTGAGMTPDQRARLFQPFERLGRDTSSIEGTGLGLVIARRLVEAMDGTLRLDSEAGVGTCVRIALPGVPVQPVVDVAEVMVESTRTMPLSPVPLRLLYVEDNRINALLFEEALRRHPEFELRVAEDGREALELVREWSPDVLVLDANLPGDSGHEVLRRLRELPRLADAPAYMCSADAMPDDVQRALAAGFQGYWTKPLDIDAVVDELHALRASLAPAD